MDKYFYNVECRIWGKLSYIETGVIESNADNVWKDVVKRMKKKHPCMCKGCIIKTISKL